MAEASTISAEKLCALTGLTDRRHRQLAREGYFPSPSKGLYQLTPTIAGIFRYYRERPRWPRYDSQQEMADDLECDVLTLKEMKSAGCDGFKSGRVYTHEWAKWMVAHSDDDESFNWSTELKKYQAKREKLRLAADEGRLVPRPEIVDAAQRGIAILFSTLDRVFCNEFPAAIKGMTETKIKARAEADIERTKEELRENWTKLLK